MSQWWEVLIEFENYMMTKPQIQSSQNPITHPNGTRKSVGVIKVDKGKGAGNHPKSCAINAVKRDILLLGAPGISKINRKTSRGYARGQLGSRLLQEVIT